MKYKMNCPCCNEEMNNIKDDIAEELGFFAFECINKCEDGYLVPKGFPDLKEVYDERDSNKEI